MKYRWHAAQQLKIMLPLMDVKILNDTSPGVLCCIGSRKEERIGLNLNVCVNQVADADDDDDADQPEVRNAQVATKKTLFLHQ